MALKIKDDIPRSDVNKEYYIQNIVSTNDYFFDNVYDLSGYCYYYFYYNLDLLLFHSEKIK